MPATNLGRVIGYPEVFRGFTSDSPWWMSGYSLDLVTAT